TLMDLSLTYRQRKANRIVWGWCINRGPTTSIFMAIIEFSIYKINTINTAYFNF
ncbi:hypothetical protein K432DRAFT_311097, partial [Lepidopterella palustris CBS 459.81]